MTKIALISDTHGYIDAQILKYCEKADEIWHAGDIGSLELADKLEKVKKFRAVYGNIDGTELRSIYPLDNCFVCDGLDVWIRHIGGYPGHYAAGLKAALQQRKPQLFISGHSHILKVMRDPALNNMLHMNPGACGVHGFHKIRTMLQFSINSGKVENASAIELGLRGEIKK